MNRHCPLGTIDRDFRHHECNGYGRLLLYSLRNHMQIHIVNRNDLWLHIICTHIPLDVIVGDFEDYNLVVGNIVFVRILMVLHNHKIVFDLIANYCYNVAEVEVGVVLVEVFDYKEDDYLLVGKMAVGCTQNYYIQDCSLCLFLCNYFDPYPSKTVDRHF